VFLTWTRPFGRILVTVRAELLRRSVPRDERSVARKESIDEDPVNVRHVDKRYFTILNDLSVPAYTVADAGVGVRLPALGRAKEPTVQLNVTNLFDASYIGPMGTGGFTVSGDSQTLQAGARRLLFLTLGTTF